MMPFRIHNPVDTGEIYAKYGEAMDEGPCMQDVLYSQIPIHPLLLAIIDTPQFQRLRFIRMLGPGYFVFNSANHTRFEHCIGVSHLAGLLLTSIRVRQPELNITNQDALCVMIAGLCHDLGHGPFSHTFEKFIYQINPQSQWKHEDASLLIFSDLLEKNAEKIQPLLTKYGMVELDIRFVKELIVGNTQMARPPEKHFLYEIVANKRNGIDVDRWDYFMRDCYHLNVKTDFEYARFIQNSRVIDVDGQSQICYRDKIADACLQMFSIRFHLHKRVYQHKTNRLIEQMLIDALESADPHVVFTGPDGSSCRLSEAIHHMSVFMLLADDAVIGRIQCDFRPELKSAQSILMRIFTRDLYTAVSRTSPVQELKYNSRELKMLLARQAMDDVRRHVDLKDIILVEQKYDFGMGRMDPMQKVNFYQKENPNIASSLPIDQISPMFPKAWHEQSLYVYYRLNDPDVVQALMYAFHSWANRQNLSVKSQMNSLNLSEIALLGNNIPDKVQSDQNLNAIRDQVFKHYDVTAPPEIEPVDMDDVMSALDAFEAAKAKPKITAPLNDENQHNGKAASGRTSPPRTTK